VKLEGNADASDAAVLAELAGLIATGELEVPISGVFPLDQVRDAYRTLEDRPPAASSSLPEVMTAEPNAVAGKIVAITGASSGIGEATARLLARRGAALFLVRVGRTVSIVSRPNCGRTARRWSPAPRT